MEPPIEKTSFGSITIAGKKYPYDIVILLDGVITKREKKLSKQIYGTSHRISLAEANHIFQEGVCQIVIGTGQFDRVTLSDEAMRFFTEHEIAVTLESTPKAIKTWNEMQGAVIGLFHVTC